MSKYIFVTGYDTRSAYSYHCVPGNRFYDTALRLGLDTAPPRRIVKGGSWIDDEGETRSAHRSHRQSHRQPRFCLGGTGLRLGLTASIES